MIFILKIESVRVFSDRFLAITGTTKSVSGSVFKFAVSVRFYTVRFLMVCTGFGFGFIRFFAHPYLVITGTAKSVLGSVFKFAVSVSIRFYIVQFLTILPVSISVSDYSVFFHTAVPCCKLHNLFHLDSLNFWHVITS